MMCRKNIFLCRTSLAFAVVAVSAAAATVKTNPGIEQVHIAFGEDPVREMNVQWATEVQRKTTTEDSDSFMTK